MAIEKEIATNFGVSAMYHKIVKIEISTQEEVVTVVTAMYATQEARDNNASPLFHEYTRVPFDQFAQDPRVPFYALLNAFDGSVFKDGITV